MADINAMQNRIAELCHQFRLPTIGAESVSRFIAAGHGDALFTFLEVLEQEAEDRRQRRIDRLRKESRLPAGKTWETFEHERVPFSLRQQLDELANGSFVEHGVNVLAFGLPGTGKTHALCAVGHRLVESGRSVLFVPRLPTGAGPARSQARPRPAATPAPIGPLRLPAPRRPRLSVPGSRGIRGALHPHRRALRAPLSRHYLEPRLLSVGAHLRQPDGHHSVILEFDVPSYRTSVAQQRSAQEVNRQE